MTASGGRRPLGRRLANIDTQAFYALRGAAQKYVEARRALTAAVVADQQQTDPTAGFKKAVIVVLSAAVLAAMRDAAVAIADRTGEDVDEVESALQAQYGPQFATATAAAQAQLLQQLNDYVNGAQNPVDPDQEALGEDDNLPVKSGWIRGALILAGGGAALGLAMASRGGGPIDDMLGQGSGSVDTSGGITGGPILTGALGDYGITPQSPKYAWDYGDGDRSEFEPHLDLDGYQFDSWDDDGLAVPPGYEWLDTPFLSIGDHVGCMCSVVMNYGDEGPGEEVNVGDVPLGDLGDESGL